MRLTLTVVDPLAGGRADVLLEADADSPISSVTERLAALFDVERSAAVTLYVGGVRVDPAMTLAESLVREGCVVSLDVPVGWWDEPAGLVEVRVVSGPGAGAVHRLGAGTHEVPLETSAPLVVRVESDGSCLVGPSGSSLWSLGEQLAVGDVLLELAECTPVDAVVTDATWVDFNRPPRLLPPEREERFTLPEPPREEEKRPLPMLMGIAPLVMAVASAMLYRQLMWLVLGLLSPLLMAAHHLVDRKRGRNAYRRKQADYRMRRRVVEQRVQEALEAEKLARRRESPDACEVVCAAVGPGRRLWERRRDDPDSLHLRVGTADLPSLVQLHDPIEGQVPLLVRDVPVSIPLGQRGVVGLAGDQARAVGRWLVVQAAVLHSPADVQIWLLTEVDGRACWEWLRWIPHARAGDGGQATVLLGNDAESLTCRIAELGAIVAERTTGDPRSSEPAIVVVMDGACRLRALPGAVQVLRDGPAVGVYTICMDADERLLPAECQATVMHTAGALRVQQMRAEVLDSVRPDLVSRAWCEEVARALAPVRDVSGRTEEGALPTSSRLLDVLNLPDPTAQAIAARWTLAGRTTQAPIGHSADGIFALDIKRDGPHGLIAGTTGSGKSELLQTLVASLAVGNRPDAMNFVLVDYKGGSAFAECARLPHTVGMVTDLDAHLVERALESLGAELKRRERILSAVGAKDIEDFTSAGSSFEPLPRLLIVIDEFASMAREMPDFVTGLVDIAQRGRSLGIHLLLATQRPSGVVSPEIRANTNLRIALRVTDDAESFDVIDSREAARIAKGTPGRGFARLGHATLGAFQAARVGGRRPGESAAPSVVVTELDWEALGRPTPRCAPVAVDDEITDLHVLVEAIRGASELLGLPPQHSPWLPALPEQLLLDEVPAVDDVLGLPSVPYGLEDLPGEQARRPALLNFARFGHLLAAGAPRSGRSQLLRTIAASIARTTSCADVHLYGLDCGNGALLPIAELPHCGAVVTRTEVERVARLIARLGAEVSRRQELLAARGFADITEQRAAAGQDERLPHIVVLLDRWEGFASSIGDLDGGEPLEAVSRLLREGASAGVHLVIVGDRSLLSSRIAMLAEEKVAFRLGDRSDFSFLGLMPRSVPDEIPAGRFFRNETGVECQVALLDGDPSGQAQAGALLEIAAKARARDAEVPTPQRPFRVDALPTRLTFEEAWRLVHPGAGPLFGLVGVGGDELMAYGPDLSAGASTFVVAGPPKSGKSTLLVSMTRSFLMAGTHVIVVAPLPSPLRALAGQPGVAAMFTGLDLGAEELQAALDALHGPGVVIMDDAELLKSCAAGEVLSDLCRRGIESHRAVVLGGDVESVCGGFSGWQVDVKKGRRGVLLGPQAVSDGDLIGVRLPRRATGRPVLQPGRALVHLGDGELVTVQVPQGH